MRARLGSVRRTRGGEPETGREKTRLYLCFAKRTVILELAPSAAHPIIGLLGLFASLPLTLNSPKPFRRPRSTSCPFVRRQAGRGYGLTVFRGTDPELIPTSRSSHDSKLSPAPNLVLGKDGAPTPRGRQGRRRNERKPGLLNGRMIGAYAYGVAVGLSPLPVDAHPARMLDEQSRPVPIFRPSRASPLPKTAEPPAPTPTAATEMSTPHPSWETRKYVTARARIPAAARTHPSSDRKAPISCPSRTPIVARRTSRGRQAGANALRTTRSSIPWHGAAPATTPTKARPRNTWTAARSASSSSRGLSARLGT